MVLPDSRLLRKLHLAIAEEAAQLLSSNESSNYARKKKTL
jgi:hypothetical protein